MDDLPTLKTSVFNWIFGFLVPSEIDLCLIDSGTSLVSLMREDLENYAIAADKRGIKCGLRDGHYLSCQKKRKTGTQRFSRNEISF